MILTKTFWQLELLRVQGPSPGGLNLVLTSLTNETSPRVVKASAMAVLERWIKVSTEELKGAAVGLPKSDEMTGTAEPLDAKVKNFSIQFSGEQSRDFLRQDGDWIQALKIWVQHPHPELSQSRLFSATLEALVKESHSNSPDSGSDLKITSIFGMLDSSDKGEVKIAAKFLRALVATTSEEHISAGYLGILNEFLVTPAPKRDFLKTFNKEDLPGFAQLQEEATACLERFTSSEDKTHAVSLPVMIALALTPYILSKEYIEQSTQAFDLIPPEEKAALPS